MQECSVSVHRLWDLTRIRRNLAHLLLKRGYAAEDVPASLTSWSPQRLGLALTRNSDAAHGDGEARWLFCPMSSGQPPVVVCFVTPFPGDRFSRETAQAHLEAFERDPRVLSAAGGEERAVILVTGEKPRSSFVNKAIAEWNQGSAFRRATRVQIMTEAQLRFDPTDRHDGPTKYERLRTAQDKEAVLGRLGCREAQLPRIKGSDRVAAFFGLQRGDVLKTERTSETAGFATDYRVVV